MKTFNWMCEVAVEVRSIWSIHYPGLWGNVRLSYQSSYDAVVGNRDYNSCGRVGAKPQPCSAPADNSRGPVLTTEDVVLTVLSCCSRQSVSQEAESLRPGEPKFDRLHSSVLGQVLSLTATLCHLVMLYLDSAMPFSCTITIMWQRWRYSQDYSNYM